VREPHALPALIVLSRRVVRENPARYVHVVHDPWIPRRGLCCP
jgi:hypothetical protein